MPLAALGGILAGTAGTAAATTGAWTALGAGAAAAGSLASASKQAGAAKDAAQLQTDAQNHAADVQAKSTADALAFQQQQAAIANAQAEANRHGNYDISAARTARLGSISEALGGPSASMPAYVPLPTGIAPQNAAALAGTTTTGGQQAGPSVASALQAPAGNLKTPVPNGDYQGWFQNLTGGKPLDQKGLLALAPQLQAAGVQITPPSAAGVVSKIGIPDGKGGTQWVRVLNGDTSVASPTVWMPQPTGGAGTQMSANTATPQYASIGDLLQRPAITGQLQAPNPYGA